MDQSLQSTTWLGWAQQLPAAEFDQRPVLSVGLAWTLLNEGLLEDAVAQLADAERLLETAPSPEQAENGALIIVDEWEFRSLPASIATARAYHAQALGDGPASERYARQALAAMPPENHVGRAIPGAIVGLAQWTAGELEAAHATMLDALHDFQQAGNAIAALSMTYGLADMRIAQGLLRDARRTYTEALDAALAMGEPAPRGTAEIYLGLAELSREQGDLSAADAFMEQSWALGEQAALPDWRYRVRVGQARLAEIRGDFDGALSLLDQAEGYYFRSPVPLLRPFAAQRTRIRLRQGHLDAAVEWARDAGLTPDDELSFLREFEHITMARVLLARLQRAGTAGTAQATDALLTRLLHAADAGKRDGSVIEILVLLALAHQAQGDAVQALACLERALALAEPEGYVRVFVDEGPAMVPLLRAAAAQGMAPAYVGRLRAACEQETLPPVTPPTPPEADRAVATPETAQPPVEPLVEPLSEREQTVLRLLATELSGPEIAQELIVSLNTMRTHTKNIYSKLGVNSRRAAVRRAQELNLL
jgi:LuxR family maltose regulon positive regulatory protein